MTALTSFRLIETDRLVLRRMTPLDGPDLFQMRSDLRMHAYTDSKPDELLEETLVYIDKMNKGIDEEKWLIWAIEERQTHKVIGSISIWNFSEDFKCAELGYGTAPDFQGKGYMKEALLAVVEFGFGVLDMDKLEAFTEQSNGFSQKLLESCHFKKTGRMEEPGYLKDQTYQMDIYSLHRTASE